LLHATAACLLAAILRRLGAWERGRPARFSDAGGTPALPVIAAFIFALHPVYVESVAWISEQKNTLSLVFYLMAALMYLKFYDGKAREIPRTEVSLPRPLRAERWYIAATGFFVLGLLSKSTTAMLPP